MSGSGKIEIYLAKGAGDLTGTVDFVRLGEVARSLPGVTRVHDGSQKEEHGALAVRVEAGETERVVLAGFSDDLHLRAFGGLLEAKGGGEALFAAVDLRGVVRGLSSADATAVAEAGLRQAAARVGATRPAGREAQASPEATLVVGAGPAALAAAAAVAGSGRPVTLVTEETELGRSALSGALTGEEAGLVAGLAQAVATGGIEVLEATTLVKAEKAGNGFRVRLAPGNGEATWREFGAIVAAPEPILVPRFEPYGLVEGPAVASMSACEAVLGDDEKLAKVLPAGEKKTVVFLVGIGREAQVVASARVLRAAARLVAMDGPVVRIVTGNLKVAGPGLEALSQEARAGGAVIFKVDPPSKPRIVTREGKLSLTCRSDILNDDIEILADMIVVDEDFEPAPVVRTLADGLRLETGPAGLLQPDNVHMAPLGTSHEGLLAVGPARGVFDLEGALVDGDAAAAALAGLLVPGAELRVKTVVDDGKCVACLTCYRLCPHDAIRFEDFPRFSPLFCQGCGICSGACPQNAITVTGCPDDRVTAEIQAAAEAPAPAGAPRFLALCCRRSAVEALRLARHLGEALPSGLRVVELPCAGRVDEEHVLAGLVAGFDGVMVLGCHDDNCRSIRGNMHARNRVSWLKPKLTAIGMEPERLWFGTVASNMSAEVAEQCRCFAAVLADLGALGSSKSAGVSATSAGTQA